MKQTLKAILFATLFTIPLLAVLAAPQMPPKPPTDIVVENIARNCSVETLEAIKGDLKRGQKFKGRDRVLKIIEKELDSAVM